MKKTIAVTIILIAVLVGVSFTKMNGTFLRLAWAADVHGNDIQFIEIHQHNGTHWNLVVNFTSSGGSTRVHDSWPINFTVNIKFNNTLADNVAEAINYTRVYMNISEGIWTNKELNNTACALVGNYYILEEQGHWNQTGKPESGVTYECTVLYQGYY